MASASPHGSLPQRGPHRVVESPALAALLEASTTTAATPASPRMVLLDVRSLRGTYEAGHLPGAHHLDPTVSTWTSPDPDPTTIQATLRALGADDDTLVVTYGGHKGIEAGRLAWLLQWAGHRSTALLDGGYEAWWRLGLPTSTEEVPPARPGDVTLSPREVLTCSTQELASFAAHRQAVDVRTRSRFGAKGPSGVSDQRVPGAVNVPSTAFGDQAGRVLDPASMRLRLRRSGVDPEQPFAVYCDDASASAWVAYVARNNSLDARLYLPGWAGWQRAAVTTPV
ncbi:sulfurtransferase [Nocardioides yefusunii]|uniref:thiosulfate sulfurtransferase n=1 Tax=Nocardioides yefusunii TaxID=2500546 RepID=A0ABW1QTT8_9ACTN|nr:rhodanese-like domain-containing protein [Nocardioides yefusunii]